MANSPSHGYPGPDPNQDWKQIRVHLQALIDKLDSEPKITGGTGGPPSTGMKVGDLHFQAEA